MQATIDTDGQLLQTAMEIGQLKTKKETIGMALQKYVQMLNNEQIPNWRGNVTLVTSMKYMSYRRSDYPEHLLSEKYISFKFCTFPDSLLQNLILRAGFALIARRN